MNKMGQRSLIFAAAAIALAAGWNASAAEPEANARPNVLFIAIDDMNDWTGFLGGHPQAITPNMDRLAKRGVNFTNAHCAAPACSPSRNALLFGVEPFHSGLYPFYELDEIRDQVYARYTSLPQLFQQNGYRTFGAGKIHHGSKSYPEDWSDYLHVNLKPLVYNAAAGYQQGSSRKMAFCPTTNPLEDHRDYQTASYGVRVISRSHDKPFFLGVGFVKPHLPFVCPQRFFDLYPDPIQPPAIEGNDLADVPWAGRAMAKIQDDFNFRRDHAWERVRRAYLACNSWTDFNVGRVLDALAASPYADNTVVVLWSDHGYHQGEKRSFRKFSLWEEATRVPFIIWDARDKSAPEDRVCKQAVSLINIYRTLADLCGLTAPDYVDGQSLTPQIQDPAVPVKQPAFTTWGRGNYAVRTEQWRYIRYFDGAEELYWHEKDPDEWRNLAGLPEFEAKKKLLASFLPEEEAPLVKKGISLWNVVDADKPDLEETRRKWSEINKTIQPPLEQ